MRLICTLDNQHKAYALSMFLLNEGIENQLDIVTNTDWGSDEYGNVSCKLWVIDEDSTDKAMAITHHFLEHPDDPRYTHIVPRPDHFKLNESPSVKLESNAQVIEDRQPIGPITLYTILICVLLFIFSFFSEPIVTSVPKGIPRTPLLSSTVNKELMYDYPLAYELIDKIVKNNGISALEEPENLPPKDKLLFEQFQNTPYWHGFYEKIVFHIKHPDTVWNFSTPLFEKIKEGQIWRIFSPALLHSDIFHILFNMLWLVVLGKQIEKRLGSLRYILFILIAGIISNTAQYLMSGSNFLGFSGVLCAMLGYIWIRQKHAAWEGYHLQPGTLGFIAFFIIFMFGLSVLGFFLETHYETSMPIGIANTAHLTGAAIGYLMGRMNYFAWQRQA